MSQSHIPSLMRGVRRGDLRSIGIAVSLVENHDPLRSAILKSCRPSKTKRPQKAAVPFVIGITGTIGAGKSTLIAGLIELIRRRGEKVAVIATDPTSPKTGGAFLGDRVRMQRVTADPRVFIRSTASRGAKGGVASAVPEIIPLFREARFNFILIETVGIGQLDYAVTNFADRTLLVLTPEGGDEMQLMKAGLFELVDGFIVNKADRPGADRMEHFLRELNRLQEKPVFKTVAEERKGLEPIYRYLMGIFNAKKKSSKK